MGERLLNSLTIWLSAASVTLVATCAETHRGYSSNKKQRYKALAKKWGGRAGLNRRPPESQSGALPTELRPPFHQSARFKPSNLFRHNIFPATDSPVARSNPFASLW